MQFFYTKLSFCFLDAYTGLARAVQIRWLSYLWYIDLSIPYFQATTSKLIFYLFIYF